MDLLFLSKRIYLGTDEGFIHGGIIVNSEGIIQKILKSAGEVNSHLYNIESEATLMFTSIINEPGRKDWEGSLPPPKQLLRVVSPTIIDRPTNAIPPTTSLAGLKLKLATARGKIYVDVGFWGGVVPQNNDDIEPLIGGGVV
ncbi:hypothetical protein DOY81_014987, partial [Sarcophaga bullata]